MNKRRRILAVITVVVIIGIGVFAALAWKPAIAPVARPEVPLSLAMVAQGRHIVALGGCDVCHTAPGGAIDAGGLPLKTPFGIVYSTNITPDRDAGIGAWSFEAFRRAMREGVSRDGHRLYPAFPYIHYTKVTDEDLRAAYAFLITRTAVHAPAHTNELPLRFRPLLAFWNVLYLRQGPELAAGNSTVERGKYLVEGLGHCSSCHTPMGAIGGEKHHRHLQGGVIDHWLAPALDQLSAAPRPWTLDQLTDYLSTGLASEHGAAAGPMRPVTDNLARVPRADAQAIAAYLLTLQQPLRSTNKQATSNDLAASIGRGKQVFAGACAECHGDGSPMQSAMQRPALSASSAIYGPSPRNAIMTILQGLDWPAQPDRTQYMPAFEHVLTDRQIVDVVAYLRSTLPNPAPWPNLEKHVADLREKRP